MTALSGYRPETWHGAGAPPDKVIAIIGAGHTHPPRGGPKKSVQGPYSLNSVFLGKLYKTKVEERPQFSGGRSDQD